MQYSSDGEEFVYLISNLHFSVLIYSYICKKTCKEQFVVAQILNQSNSLVDDINTIVGDGDCGGKASAKSSSKRKSANSTADVMFYFIVQLLSVAMYVGFCWRKIPNLLCPGS